MAKWLGIVSSCGKFDRNGAEFGMVDLITSGSAQEPIRYYENKVTKGIHPREKEMVFCEVEWPKAGEKRQHPRVTSLFLASIANENDDQELLSTYFEEHAKTAEKILKAFRLKEHPEEMRIFLQARRKGYLSVSASYNTFLKQKVDQYLKEQRESEEALDLLVQGAAERVIGMPGLLLWKYPGYFLKNPEKNLPYWADFLKMVYGVPSDRIEITPEYFRQIGEISVQHNKTEIFKEPTMRAKLSCEDIIRWYRLYEKTTTREMKMSMVRSLSDHILEVLPEAEPYARRSQLARKVECTNRRKIKQILKERNISCFVHFTDVQNLSGILEQGGLMTRQKLEEQHAAFSYTDEQRLEHNTDSLSLSISFPNYQMFYKKQQEYPERKWCVLELDAEKIVDKLLIVNSENAAASSNQGRKITEEGCAELFVSLFDEKTEKYERKELASQYTTNPQAEILCLEKIPLQDIICCYFDFDEEKSVKEPYQKLLGQAGIRAGNSKKYFSYGPYLQYHKKGNSSIDPERV